MLTCALKIGRCLLAMAAWMEVTASAEVPIEGPAELIDYVLKAQHANAAKYAQGFLDADVEFQFGASTTVGHVESLWSKDGTYWKYSSVQEDGNRRETHSSEVIRHPKGWIFYTPVARLVQTTETKVFSLHREAEILPSDVWFNVDEHIPLTKLLDPKILPDLLNQYVIGKDDDGLITVEKHYKIGGYYSVRISPAHNGNVVSYDTVQEKSQGSWRRGRYQWETTEEGDWYVKELELERSLKGTPDEIDYHLTVTINSYDPKPKIHENRFSLSSLTLPPKTKIEVYDAEGKQVR